MTLSSTFRERERRRGEKASILELVDLVSRPLSTKNHMNAYESTEDSVKLQIGIQQVCGTALDSALLTGFLRRPPCRAPDPTLHSGDPFRHLLNLVALDLPFNNSASQFPNL